MIQFDPLCKYLKHLFPQLPSFVLSSPSSTHDLHMPPVLKRQNVLSVQFSFSTKPKLPDSA